MYSGRPLQQNPFDKVFAPWDVPTVEAPHEEQHTVKYSIKAQRSMSSEPLEFNSLAASSSQSANLSASPAAMFLSAFMAAPQPVVKPDDEGQVIAGYALGPVIGYGATSIIRRASSSSGGVVAVKIVRRADLVKAGNAPLARRRLQHEAAVWATLSHEHILPLFSAVHDPYADFFFTLYCPAGSLFDILLRDGTPALPQDDAGMMFRQVVRGLRYLHEEARYVHRDMKLENVLVDEMGVCKIGDFGMTRRIDAGISALTTSESEEEEDLEDQQQEHPNPDLLSPGGHHTVHRAVSLTVPSHKKQTKNSVNLNHALSRFNTTRHRNSTSTNQPSLSFQPGSLPYAAPELLLPHTSESLSPHPCQDIWALGVMLYALLAGRLPFSDNFEPRLQMKILNGHYDCPKDIGRGAERILHGCLERSISNRWTIAMVDEVAWGVGWGAEGDDAHPADLHEEEAKTAFPSRQASRSRSRMRPADIVIPLSGIEERRSRPSVDTANCRSTSRTKRSLSRAPVLTDLSTFARSASRRSARSGSSTPSTSDPLSATSLISCAYGSAYDDSESALLISPTSSTSSSYSNPILRRGRGRWTNRAHHSTSYSRSRSKSRSLSPSVVPPTPRDGPVLLASPTEDLHLDATAGEDVEGPSRGRSTIRNSMDGADLDADVDDVHHVRVQVKSGKQQPSATPPGLNAHDDEWAEVEAEKMMTSPKGDFLGSTAARQHRPSSSPPTPLRMQIKESLTTSHTTSGLERLLGASSAATHGGVIQRSRSAEHTH